MICRRTVQQLECKLHLCPVSFQAQREGLGARINPHFSRVITFGKLCTRKRGRERRETQSERERESARRSGAKKVHHQGSPPSLPFFFSPRSAIPPILIGIGPMQQQQQQWQLRSAQPVRSLPLYLPRSLSLYLSIV